MKINLDGKVAIITGAAGGIGKGIAKAFLQNSAKVVIADIQDALGEQTVAELAEFGKCIYIHADVTDIDQADSLVATTKQQFGRIDIFVNNAGTNLAGDKRVDIDEFLPEVWDKLLSVNLTGVFNCSRAVAKVMIAQKSGRIINIGSVLGSVPARQQIAFIAAKGGLHNMAKAMALELAPHGIAVNVIAPGSIALDISLFKEDGGPMAQFRKDMLSHVPMGRFGNVDDIANSALFLSGDESAYITGHVLTVDGGWTCGYTRNF